MPFTYSRVIRFHETDAAGVVYFANLLSLCHEAYESSLARASIDLKAFFSGANGVAVPVVHAEADFYRPMFCGDAIAITLTPEQLDADSFEIAFEVANQMADRTANEAADGPEPELLARALTRHVCISVLGRRRHPLTADLVCWLAQGGRATGRATAAD